MARHEAEGRRDGGRQRDGVQRDGVQRDRVQRDRVQRDGGGQHDPGAFGDPAESADGAVPDPAVPDPAVPDPVVPDPVVLLRDLATRGQTLAVAESLTGGLLAARLVDVPGASAVFRGGLVVYATDLKASLGGVPDPLLAERGPVDPDVAVALAAGARRRCRADWGVATTGVAGPDPQGGVPVGTVHVAVAGPTGGRARSLVVAGDRAGVRQGAVVAALRLLREALGYGL